MGAPERAVGLPPHGWTRTGGLDIEGALLQHVSSFVDAGDAVIDALA